MVLLMSVLFGFHGIIENDTTWSDTAYLTGDVLIEEGITLIIDPGTVVLFADSCEWDTAWYYGESEYSRTCTDRVDLIAEGNLEAIGSIQDSIYIHSQDGEYEGRGRIIFAGEWATLQYCSLIEKEKSVYEILLLNTQIDVSECRFEEVDCFFGEESRLVLKRSVFSEIDGQVLILEGGILIVEDCFFLNIKEFDYGVIEANGLDSCCMDNIRIENAQAYNQKLYGGKAFGCYICDCHYVAVKNSAFVNIKGGIGGPASGNGGNGGDGCALYLDSCEYVLIRSNQIDSIRGGNGLGDDVENYGHGGDGLGVYLKNCTNVSIDNNIISHLFGGYGEMNPDGFGVPKPLICRNSSPEIISNEFNSGGIYVYIDSTSQPVIGGAPGRGNKFCVAAKYSRYVIYNDSPFDIDATCNYWETGVDMIDSLIFDYYDDPTKGIVHYDHATDVEEKLETAPQALVIKSNLVGDILHVSFAGSLSGGAKLELFDASGRKILSQAITEPQTAINVSDLPRGVYFVSARIGDEIRFNEKVVISK